MSDVFVLLDDVEYSKNSFFNRNSIKTRQGRLLLTVPVLYRGNSSAKIHEIYVSQIVNWRKKHFRTIEQAYSRAPFWNHYRDDLAKIYDSPCTRLIEIVIPMIKLFSDVFSIHTPIYLSSELGIEGKRNEKLVKICKQMGGTHFIVKENTESYHPQEEFVPHGIKLVNMTYSSPVYSQLYSGFEPFLSALDYLLNCGPVRPPFTASIKL